MRRVAILFSALILMGSAFRVSAALYYVNANNATPAAPYSTWADAATNLQDAVNSASDGDTVLVANGVYSSGGLVMAGDLTNRVAIIRAVTVQSVNGPLATVIAGAGATNGPSAIRCAWLTNGASLVGFTLTGGATRNVGDTVTLQDGGAAWCSSTNAYLRNCIISTNTAASDAAGVFQGSVYNSLVSSNGTVNQSGATIAKSVLNHCTVVSNYTRGVTGATAMTNCLIYFNRNGNFQATGSAFSHCCTTPALAGTGNFTTAPNRFQDGLHLLLGSPCIGAGVATGGGADLFGNAWADPPAVGCIEWQPAPLVSTPQSRLAIDPVGFSLGNAMVSGALPMTFAWLKDGAPLQDNGHFVGSQSTNLVALGLRATDPGAYQLVVGNAFGAATSSVATLVIHCVDPASTHPAPPYLTWNTAAATLQDAISVALAGELVLATNGVYATGGKSMDGIITNRVSVDKPILLGSVNGAAATIIQGNLDPVSTNGPAAIRCVYMTNGAMLAGFTLRGGATRANDSTPNNGGGLWCESSVPIPIINNCVLTGNFARANGGGAYQGQLLNCTLMGNSTLTPVGGGSFNGTGGGAANCGLVNCLVVSNLSLSGAGAAACRATNCAFTQNQALVGGSAAVGSTLVNCTVAGNSRPYLVRVSDSTGGAVTSSTLFNSIVYGNYHFGPGATNYYACTFSYSDSDPLPAGTGNFDADPRILSDGIHLMGTSPCIAMGNPAWITGTDLDGQAWKSPPAMGCDEWVPRPMIVAQPTYQLNPAAHLLSFTVAASGQAPFAYFWSKDGISLQDDAHYLNTGTATISLRQFGLEHAGAYQVVVTNALGSVTSAVVQLVIHGVDAQAAQPQAPYSTWATAATTIQDAIDAAMPGEIVLVTNGLYSSGGKVLAGDLTNRVALDKALTVLSVNGFPSTVIQGVWDAATNGPGAIRCAGLLDGAVLCGFTLQQGGTRTNGDVYSGGPTESGGGAWCASTNGLVLNCLLTNNAGVYGGGFAFGTLNNSLVCNNSASYGAGAYGASLNNCTVVQNLIRGTFARGAGTYGGSTRNCIVMGNYDYILQILQSDNYGLSGKGYTNCCTDPLISGGANIDANPLFLDAYHLAATSPCRGAGNAAYASGFDLDGEPWLQAPSIGCDEVIEANLVGPISASFSANYTNMIVNTFDFFNGSVVGRAATASWSFGDGGGFTNVGSSANHVFSQAGDFPVTFTVYNLDHPNGVSATILVHVQALLQPQIQSPYLMTNAFQFQFAGQASETYFVEYTTNLAPPVVWTTLKQVFTRTDALIPITDAANTNEARYYRIWAR